MNRETMPDENVHAHDLDPTRSVPESPSEQKKPFVKPALTRHESLPNVTTGFFGTFYPPPSS